MTFCQQLSKHMTEGFVNPIMETSGSIMTEILECHLPLLAESVSPQCLFPGSGLLRIPPPHGCFTVGGQLPIEVMFGVSQPNSLSCLAYCSVGVSQGTKGLSHPLLYKI
jgi:hypothetical protein